MIGSCQFHFSISPHEWMYLKMSGLDWVCGAFILPESLESFPYMPWWTGGYDSVCTLEGSQPARGCREAGTWGWHHESTQWGAAESLGMSLRSHGCGTRRAREASFFQDLLVALCMWVKKEAEREEAGGQRHTKISSFTLESVGNPWIANPNKSGPAYDSSRQAEIQTTLYPLD